ncbi:MAG: TlyA family RNA methyltransferase [Caulobacteraceae bacterium]
MDEKERLDVLVYKLGLSVSREKASSQVMSGIVYVNGVKIDKPGTKVSVDSKVEVRGNAIPYVSRGGLKLEKAMNTFNINISGKTAMDIGASTGGFTDCLLKNGASKVFAVDVGYGQLAWELRTDNKVICMERTNIRYVTPADIGEAVDFATIDVSFISLTKVLPAVYNLLSPSGKIVCLIKPQFEAGREKVGKKGVVKDKNVHMEVISSIIDFCTGEMDFTVFGLTFSPIKGPEGNIEYLLYLSKEKNSSVNTDTIDIAAVVDQANGEL